MCTNCSLRVTAATALPRERSASLPATTSSIPRPRTDCGMDRSRSRPRSKMRLPRHRPCSPTAAPGAIPRFAWRSGSHCSPSRARPPKATRPARGRATMASALARIDDHGMGSCPAFRYTTSQPPRAKQRIASDVIESLIAQSAPRESGLFKRREMPLEAYARRRRTPGPHSQAKHSQMAVVRSTTRYSLKTRRSNPYPPSIRSTSAPVR